MPRPAPARRPPPPRRKILWMRAVPIFLIMMAGLILLQTFALPLPGVRDSVLNYGNGLVLSLIFGAGGAFAISRWATVMPPPPPSKTQQRKLAAAARARNGSLDDDEEEEVAPVRPRSASQRRRRRRH